MHLKLLSQRKIQALWEMRPSLQQTWQMFSFVASEPLLIFYLCFNIIFNNFCNAILQRKRSILFVFINKSATLFMNSRNLVSALAPWGSQSVNKSLSITFSVAARVRLEVIQVNKVKTEDWINEFLWILLLKFHLYILSAIRQRFQQSRDQKRRKILLPGNICFYERITQNS